MSVTRNLLCRVKLNGFSMYLNPQVHPSPERQDERDSESRGMLHGGDKIYVETVTDLGVLRTEQH